MLLQMSLSESFDWRLAGLSSAFDSDLPQGLQAILRYVSNSSRSPITIVKVESTFNKYFRQNLGIFVDVPLIKAFYNKIKFLQFTLKELRVLIHPVMLY